MSPGFFGSLVEGLMLPAGFKLMAELRWQL